LRNIHKHNHFEENQPVEVTIRAVINGALQITIQNNGTPINTSPVSSSGQGLSLHNALLTIFGGGLRLDHPAEALTRVIISLPVTGNRSL
jgi:glucose-6-phosphate-specific signal transduction histidine kinase